MKEAGERFVIIAVEEATRMSEVVGRKLGIDALMTITQRVARRLAQEHVTTQTECLRLVATAVHAVQDEQTREPLFTLDADALALVEKPVEDAAPGRAEP